MTRRLRDKRELWQCASYLRPLAVLCAQTLADLNRMESQMRPEQLNDPSVLDAKADYELCPAVVELVCEALGSSGAKPKGVFTCLSNEPLLDPSSSTCMHKTLWHQAGA